MQTVPPFYVVIRTTRRSTRFLGKGSLVISQFFQDPEYCSGSGNQTHHLLLCSQAISSKQLIMDKNDITLLTSEWGK